MKNYFKALLILMLVIACVLTCASCDNNGGQQSGSDAPQGDNSQTDNSQDNTGTPDNPPADQPNVDVVPDEPVDPSVPVDPVEPVVETYKVNFVYSYTTKILNDFGRPKTVKEKITVKTIEIPKDNTGFTAEMLADKDSILYHGYGFYEWYAEADWQIDDANNTQFPKEDAVAFDFSTGAVTSDMTLYGVKGNLAGREAFWEIEERTVIDAKGDPQLEVVLKISGKGAMFDYEKTNAIDIPWYAYSVSEIDESTGKSKEIRNYTGITKLEISPEITYIGDNAFNGLTGVATLDLGEDSQLESIGDAAFKNVASLRSFVAPSKLKHIGNSAFDTTGLTSIWFNEGLTTIADSAFQGSKGISWIILPSTIESIGVAAFHPGPGQDTNSHSLSKIYYTGAAPADGSTIFQGMDIGFDNNALTQKATVYYYLEAADGVDTRGAYWYYFEGENSTKAEPMPYCLTIKYYLPGNTVSAHWVDYVTAAPKWEVNKNGVGSYKLVGTIDKANVDFRDDQITHNGYRFAEYGDEGKYTFNGGKSDFCEGAKLADNISCNLKRGSILSEGGGVTFAYGSGTLSVALDPSAIKEGASTEIWNFADGGDTGTLWTGSAAGLKNITELVIGDGITYIGALTFNGIGNLSYVVIPSSVKGISENAFSGCTNLSSIYYQGDLSECAIYDTAGNPTGKTLADKALTGLLKTTYYSYSATGTSEDGTYWSVMDGKYIAWILDKTAGTLFIGGDAEMVDFGTESDAPWYSDDVIAAVKSVEFASNITTLGENVLHRYYNVENVTLPRTLTKVPESALAGTALLQDTGKYPGGSLIINNILLKVDPRRQSSALYEIPFNTALIAGGAFDGCDMIEEIYIPSTVRNIGDGSLADLVNLKVLYTDILTATWKGMATNAGLSSAVYFCGYDDYDFDGDGIVDERLWQKVNNEYTLFVCGPQCNHESGEKFCKHVWGEWYVLKNQTHTANGVMARQCTNPGCCVNDLDNESLLKADTKVDGKYVHVFGAYVIDDVSYCVTNRTETAKCIYCNELDVVTLPNTMIGSHNFAYAADGNATCHSVGTKTGSCTNPFCYEVSVLDDPVGQPKLPHAPADEFVCENDAYCNTKFHYVKYCTNPGCDVIAEEYYIDNNEPWDHQWVEVAANKYLAQRATVYSSNVYYKSCSECGKSCKGITDETFVSYGTALNLYGWDDANLRSIITSSGKFDTVSNLDKYNYAISVAEGAKKVLEIGKVSGAADSILRITNANAENSSSIVHVFSTQFKIGSYTAKSGVDVTALDYVYRLGMANVDLSFFNLYFVDGGATVAIKDSIGDGATTFAQVSKSVWFDISVSYDAVLKQELIDMTPEVDVNSPDYDPDYVPETIFKTVYYYDVTVTINGVETAYKYVVDSKAGIANATFSYVESEIASQIDSAKFYMEDTFLRSISKSSLAIAENTTPDPVEPPVVEEPEVRDPMYTFDTDSKDEIDGVIENPADGIDINIKDGKKDNDGNYVYADSEIADGKLVINTAANDKVYVDAEGNVLGLQFSTATAFAIVGELSDDAAKRLYIFESKLNIGKGTHQIVFANSNHTLESFAFEIAITDKGLVIVDTNKGLDGVVSEITVAGITAATEFDFRVELYRFETTDGEKLVAKFFVDDVYVGMSDSAVVSGKKIVDYAIESVVIYHKADADTAITLDDVYVGVTDNEVVYTPEVVVLP